MIPAKSSSFWLLAAFLAVIIGENFVLVGLWRKVTGMERELHVLQVRVAQVSLREATMPPAGSNPDPEALRQLSRHDRSVVDFLSKVVMLEQDPHIRLRPAQLAALSGPMDAFRAQLQKANRLEDRLESLGRRFSAVFSADQRKYLADNATRLDGRELELIVMTQHRHREYFDMLVDYLQGRHPAL